MIHDLDLIRLLVPEDVVSLEAVGVPVVTSRVDIANARLRFAGGCIANVTASRVSVKRERKLRLFQPDMYLAIDLGERSVRICRRAENERGEAEIAWEQIDLGEADALAREIEAFLASVRTRARPAVTGEDGSPPSSSPSASSCHGKRLSAFGEGGLGPRAMAVPPFARRSDSRQRPR
jgi:predicted dehydrogenase